MEMAGPRTDRCSSAEISGATLASEEFKTAYPAQVVFRQLTGLDVTETGKFWQSLPVEPGYHLPAKLNAEEVEVYKNYLLVR